MQTNYFLVPSKSFLTVFIGLACIASLSIQALGQSPANIPLLQKNATPTGKEKNKPVSEEMVKLNFPNEVELEGLVEYVSHRLGIKILYDESINGKRVRVRAPGEIPADSLMMVLQSALKMKGLTMVDADVKGWKQIRKAENLAKVAPRGTAKEVAEQHGAAAPVMQVFMPKHIDLAKIEQIIKPFLSEPGGSITPVKESGVLIVTDYAANVLRVAELIEMIDRPRPDVLTEFIKVENVEAGELAKQLTTILNAQNQAQGRGAEMSISVSHDARTNQLILVGRREKINTSLGLIKSLDVPSSLVTEVYPFQYTAARRIDQLIRKSLDPTEAKRVYRAVIDPVNNSLVATTTKEIHKQIETLKKRVDIPVAQKQSPMQFYKLKNTTVGEVLKTLRALQKTDSTSGRQSGSFGAFGSNAFGRDTIPAANNDTPGAFRLPLEPGQAPPNFNVVNPVTGREVGGAQPKEGHTASMPFPTATSGGGTQFSQNARITADVNTNTLIIIAEPQVQEYYAKLIKLLDNRSPQVLIEARIVTIDTTGKFSLGVEISGGDRTGAKKLFAFSSFGLSTPNPVTGALALIPGTGFNGTLVDPSVADVIVRAMEQHARAKVLASPRILVNDNMEGRLQSVVSIPYESVNSSTTVSTTSLGGNQDAGTMISVTPHIGEDDNLQLEFSIQFSSFGESGSGNLPPPRHIDQVDSTVTIPDGHTVIVGGLNRHNRSKSVSGLPFLQKIPIVKYAVSNHTIDESNTSLFVFIRPIILRKDKFEDLKFLSNRDVHAARICPDLPTSRPIRMR